MTRIRWGILGPGGIAATFVADLLGAIAQGADPRAAQLTVDAVGSRDLAKARDFAERFDIPRAYGSYEQLVADPALDAIYIATPNSFHREQALLAIRAGKHVLVEKPFTLDAAEARDVFEAADSVGVVALEAMWTRFLPQNDRLRRILREGVVGEPRLFLGTHLQKLSTDPHHRVNDPALGGGALLDLGVYPVSFVHDFLGAPRSVKASGLLSPLGVDQRTGAVLEHAADTQSLIHTALDLAGPNTGTLHATGGRIEIDAPFFTPHGFTVIDADGAVVERYAADERGLRGMQHQAYELARLVADGASETDRLSPDDTVQVMETLDEIRRQVGVRYPSGLA